MGFFRRDDASSCSDESAGEIFKCIPKGTTGFCIWKIEGLRTISLGKTKAGTFLSDSAYLIYAASAKDGPLPYPGMPTKELKDSQAVRSIHFWVGSECESSVSGTAALRAAELDSQLQAGGGATVLMREAQGRESPRFLAYFRRRAVTVNAPRPVDDDDDDDDDGKGCTLHRVGGTGLPVLTELRPIGWACFSSRHVYILHVTTRSVIYLWLGSNCEPLHKSHAMKLIEEHKSNAGKETRVFVVEDGYEQTLQPEARRLFDEILNPSVRFVSPEPLVQSYLPSTSVKLYKCSEQTGKYKVAELKSGPISARELESGAVFLVERGEAGVWAWVGRDSSPKERLEAVRNARGFVKKKGYSPSCPVGRALEAAEPGELRAWIRGWAAAGNARATALILPGSFEPEYMAERPRLAAECQLVDDGSGERRLWLLEAADRGSRLRDLENDRAVFYAEAVYVLRYRYGYGRKTRTIVYYWEGVHSACNDRNAGLEAACLLAEEESAQLIITSQGKEPSHLLQIYNGKLIILSGPHRNAPPKKYLVRVYGSTPYTSKAVERPLRASSLDSKGVFILFSNSPTVWCGSRSTGDAREASRRLAPPTAPLICEGKEDDEFWTQLGGRGVCNVESIDIENEDMEKRLYHLKIEKKMFTGEEILGYSQSSLLPEAAWLLDTGNVIWIWVGSYAIPKSLKDYVEDAKIFLYTHPASRDRNTIISIIKQGMEPSTFIGLFENWNHNLLRDYRPFGLSQSTLQDQDALINDMIAIKMVSEFDNFIKYPLKILRNNPDKLPPGIDVSRKEMHLTFDDFMSVFKMEPKEFEKLPIWRRQRLKQTAGLF